MLVYKMDIVIGQGVISALRKAEEEGSQIQFPPEQFSDLVRLYHKIEKLKIGCGCSSMCMFNPQYEKNKNKMGIVRR